MPQITKISPQKRKDRYNIFVDEKFAFGVSVDTLVSQSLKVGQKLTEEEIAKIIKKEDFAKLFDSSLKLLSTRPRSEKEITDYLAKKIAKNQNIKFREAAQSIVIVKVMEKLKKLKYLNDLEFASWWAAARSKQAKGPRLIRAELIQKGISSEIIGKVLSSAVSQKELAKKAIEKKIKIWKNLSGNRLKRKVYTYLASRGFDWDTIKEKFAFLEGKS